MRICIVGGTAAHAALLNAETDIVLVEAHADGSCSFTDASACAVEPELRDVPVGSYAVRVLKAYAYMEPPVMEMDVARLKLSDLPTPRQSRWESERGDCIRRPSARQKVFGRGRHFNGKR